MISVEHHCICMYVQTITFSFEKACVYDICEAPLYIVYGIIKETLTVGYYQMTNFSYKLIPTAIVWRHIQQRYHIVVHKLQLTT